MLCLSRNPRDKRANRVVPYRRKEADGLTFAPWQSGKSLCWDVTVICPLAESYVTGSARQAGAAAELAAYRKEEKYASIGSECLYAPIAVETLGPMNTSARQLFANLENDLLGVRQ